MRFALPAALLLILAGCAGTPTLTTSSGPAPAASGLDCTLGSFEHALNSTWMQTCEARASHSPGPKEETWVGINPTNPDNVVVGAKDLNPASSAHCVWNGVFVTHDGGHTWKDVTIGGAYADRAPTSPFYGYACNTDPDFRFSKDGSLHYGIEMYNFLGTTSSGPVGQGYKILLATSHDGGDTWPDVVVYQPDFVVTTDYSRMIVNPTTQTILEAIGSEEGVGCHVLASRDNGKSADPPVPVVTKDGVPCGSGADTAIAASPKGVVVIVGGISSGSNNEPVVVRSMDDGKSWTDSNLGFPHNPIPGSFSESKYRTPTVIELAYDLTNGTRSGTLYACYPSAERTSDEADIYVRSSTDDGRTWSAPVMVNHDAPGAHQWMCNIAVAGDGSLHAFFMDKSYDPDHKLIGITHAVSRDGGKNWTDERVSTVNFDGDLGVHQDGFPFIGDYMGVAAVGPHVWAGFPDASNGKTTVIAAAHVMAY
ncbi:MAG: sialidase family protein [Thermoplasmatota archaeon]